MLIVPIVLPRRLNVDAKHAYKLLVRNLSTYREGLQHFLLNVSVKIAILGVILKKTNTQLVICEKCFKMSYIEL